MIVSAAATWASSGKKRAGRSAIIVVSRVLMPGVKPQTSL